MNISIGTIISGLGQGSGSGSVTEYVIPSDFSTEFTNRIFKSGTTYSTDYDFNAVKNTITGNTAYVDLTNGSDANPGTSIAPFKTMGFAMTQAFNIYYGGIAQIFLAYHRVRQRHHLDLL